MPPNSGPTAASVAWSPSRFEGGATSSLVTVMADRGLWHSSGKDCVNGSKRSLYRGLQAHGQEHVRV
jgi:hypothetical protein